METWASQCSCATADRPGTAARAAPGARPYPFSLLGVQLAQQTTGAGTTFLRWRNLDRSANGRRVVGGCWPPRDTGLAESTTWAAMELQRIALNMQISLTHSIARHALECASGWAPKPKRPSAACPRACRAHSTTPKESP